MVGNLLSPRQQAIIKNAHPDSQVSAEVLHHTPDSCDQEPHGNDSPEFGKMTGPERPTAGDTNDGKMLTGERTEFKNPLLGDEFQVETNLFVIRLVLLFLLSVVLSFFTSSV